MKRIIGFCTLVLFASLTLYAGGTKTLKGYVVDQMCAAKMATKENVMDKAAAHTSDCALEEDCASSGYGIFSEGKFYKFDEKGSAKAKTLIGKSKRTNGLYFEATGTVGDGAIEVATLKEASPPKKEVKSAPKN